MAKRVQRRRGTTSEHSSFTGYVGEVTVDTTKDTTVVHDGVLAGGRPTAREDLSNVNLVNLIGVTELNLSDGTNGQVIQTNGSGTISFGTIDISGTAVGGDISGTIGNAQIIANAVGITELNVSDGTSGQALTTNGSGVLAFSNVLTDPALGGELSGTTSNAVIVNEKVTEAKLAVALKNFDYDEHTGNGSTDTFTLSATPGSENAVLAYIDGIVQPTSAFALLTGPDRIQFTTAPPNNAVIRCLHLGFQATVGVPSDGSISTAKIAANAVIESKIADGSITNAKLGAAAVTAAKITNQTITATQIAAGTITTTQILDGTIVGSDIAANSIDGTKLALASQTQGDVMYYSGTDWVRLGPGTSGYVLKTAGASANPSWLNPTTVVPASVTGATGAGSVVQRQVTTVTAFVQGSATEMILNDVIPTNSQGAEFMTVSITPKSATNRLLIWTNAWFDGWNAGEFVGALFQDNVVNALACGSEDLGSAEQQTGFHLAHDMVAGTTSATIFKLRAGKNADGGSAVAMGMNGLLVATPDNSSIPAGRRHGGVCSSQIVVEEYVPYTP